MKIMVLGDVSTCVLKAYASSAVKVQVHQLVGLLSMSPETSDCGMVVISENQANPKANPVLHKALQTRHKDVTLVYFYRADKGKDYLADVPSVISYKVPKYKEDVIKDCIDKTLGGAELSAKAVNLSGYADVSSDVGNAVNPFKRDGVIIDNDTTTKVKEDDPFGNSAGHFSSVVNLDEMNNAGWDKSGLHNNGDDGDEFDRPDDDDVYYSDSPSGSPSPATPNYEEEHEGDEPSVFSPPPLSETTSLSDFEGNGEPGVNDIPEIPSVGLDYPTSNASVFPAKTPVLSTDRNAPMREMVKHLDTTGLKNMLNNNILQRELMRESSDYQNTMQSIQAIDAMIQETFIDPRLSNVEKLARVKQLAFDRTTYRALKYDSLVRKYLDTLSTMATIAQDTVTEQLENVKTRYAGLDVAELYYADREALDDVVAERMQCQLSLIESVKRLQEIYLLFDDTKDALTSEMLEEPPTLHPILNASLGDHNDQLIPHNVARLIDKLIQGVDDRRIVFSSIQSELVNVVEQVFTLFDSSAKVIDKTMQLNRLLSANRVESVIVSSDVLKYKLRGFVGPANVGRTVTALGAATAMSRIDNTILIDLSDHAKLSNYVRNTISLEEFYEGYKTQRLLCVQRTPGTDVSVYTLHENLKRCVAHYSWILVLASAKDSALLDWLYDSALSINFISTPHQMNLQETKGLLNNFTAQNTARVVTLVGSQMEPTTIANYLDVDVFSTRFVNVPIFPEVQTATLAGTNPCDHPEVLDFFIEMMRS